MRELRRLLKLTLRRSAPTFGRCWVNLECAECDRSRWRRLTVDAVGFLADRGIVPASDALCRTALSRLRGNVCNAAAGLSVFTGGSND